VDTQNEESVASNKSVYSVTMNIFYIQLDR